MKMGSKHHHFLGATLMVAGTCIGVGMLALPIVTALGGFLPSLAIYLICWLAMIAFAFVIMEACLWMPEGANLFRICRSLLGKPGAILCWFLYLFLFYCLMTAHMAAGGEVVASLSQQTIPNWVSTILYLIVFAPAVYLGTRSVDRLNIALMIGLVITFILFCSVISPYLQINFLERSDWGQIWLALPVVITAFGFQNLVPTLLNYMERDYRRLRKAIWIGASIPLVLYLVWEILIVGVVPLNDLMVAMKTGKNAVVPLQEYLQNPILGTIAQVFAFFAMTTSFIGISIAFFDFWSDWLTVEKFGRKRWLIAILVFALPLAFVFIYPNIFFTALNFAGGFGMIILLGILPLLCVWVGRYVKKLSPHQHILGGGKLLLAILFAFCVATILIEILL